jgi:hypothetical protein
VAEIQGVADELPALLLRLKTLEAVHQEVRWLIVVVKGGDVIVRDDSKG